MTTSENMTRAEAKERSALLHVESYDVTLDLTTDQDTFNSLTTVQFTCRKPGASTRIDLLAPRVNAIFFNGAALDPAEVFTGTHINLANLEEDNLLIVNADCQYSNTGEGLHKMVDPVDKERYVYSQCETADARRIYACFDQPDLKATFQLTVAAPSHWKVISNSLTPEPEVEDDGTALWSFIPTPRISTYITALVGGPYHEVRDSYTGKYGTYPMSVYCRESLAEFLDADDILGITKEGFAFFEEQFATPYPFDKYDQLFVPEFNAGAMENAGCVTFRDDYVYRSRVTDAAYEWRANTILHELAHMWFGDLVTMKWWDDLWLNESFAEWASHWCNEKATRYKDAWTTFSNQRKAWAYRQDQLPSTHPIASDMVDLDTVKVNFDGITYAKGASAIKQLVAWVGEENFVAGLRRYFGKHAWGNTELSDLLTELEATSGRDLSEWTTQWLQTSGVNLLRPVVAVNPDGAYASVIIQQEPPSAPEGVAQTLRSHRIGVGLYDVTGDELILRDSIELDVVGAATPVPQLVGVKQPDLLLVNDGDLTFAKIRLDERSWKTATEHLGNLVDPLARTLVWGAAWDMTRDAEVSTGDFLTLVLSGIGRETDIGVVQQVLRQTKSAIDMFAAPERRTGYLVRLADALKSLAESAMPGSDHQLQFARSFASAATNEEQLATVAALLDGSLAWEGLAIDTDMRWHLLQRLAVAGRLEDDAIEAEQLRDDTAAGHKQAALARAARPTAAAKELAWADVVDRTDISNAVMEMIIAGFNQPDQLDELRPYRDRYFEVLPRVWTERTWEMAAWITEGMYPTLLVEQETVDATDAFLAGEMDFGLRRLLNEGKDGVERALRARAKDA